MRTRRKKGYLRGTFRAGVRDTMTKKQMIDKLKELGVVSGLSGKTNTWLKDKLSELGHTHLLPPTITKPKHIIREKFDLHKQSEKIRWVSALRANIPKYSEWSDEEILDAHNKHVSIVQSTKSKSGTSLEKIIEGFLEENDIPFKAQVSIDKDGIINERGLQTHAIPDIVIGNPTTGDSIKNYIVLSLKTTSRERAKQDDWTKRMPPKLFLYVTASNDYPSPDKFDESETRRIITDSPKSKDTRKFKLGFDELIDVLKDFSQ